MTDNPSSQSEDNKPVIPWWVWISGHTQVSEVTIESVIIGGGGSGGGCDNPVQIPGCRILEKRSGSELKTTAVIQLRFILSLYCKEEKFNLFLLIVIIFIKCIHVTRECDSWGLVSFVGLTSAKSHDKWFKIVTSQWRQNTQQVLRTFWNFFRTVGKPDGSGASSWGWMRERTKVQSCNQCEKPHLTPSVKCLYTH